MKPLLSSQRNQALTRVDVIILVVIAVLFALWMLNNPGGAAIKRRAQRINCVSNLKQIALSARIWEGDHGNQYPMSVSVTNGGGREWIATGNIAACFRVMSNELSATKILICPADEDRMPATNFTTGFDNSHIGYFVSLNASEIYPQQLFMGDSNLMTNGVPLKSGVVDISCGGSISWTKARHRFVGNVSFADGSVAEESALGLENALLCSTNGTPFAYNRYVIP